MMNLTDDEAHLGVELWTGKGQWYQLAAWVKWYVEREMGRTNAEVQVMGAVGDGTMAAVVKADPDPECSGTPTVWALCFRPSSFGEPDMLEDSLDLETAVQTLTQRQ